MYSSSGRTRFPTPLRSCARVPFPPCVEIVMNALGLIHQRARAWIRWKLTCWAPATGAVRAPRQGKRRTAAPHRLFDYIRRASHALARSHIRNRAENLFAGGSAPSAAATISSLSEAAIDLCVSGSNFGSTPPSSPKNYAAASCPTLVDTHRRSRPRSA